MLLGVSITRQRLSEFFICPIFFLFQIWNVSDIFAVFTDLIHGQYFVWSFRQPPAVQQSYCHNQSAGCQWISSRTCLCIWDICLWKCKSRTGKCVCVCVRMCMCVNNYLCFNLSFWACCWCCSELMWENCALIFSFHAERELLPVQRCLSVSPYSVFHTRERSSLAYM